MVEQFLIRTATEPDIAALPDIERRAATIFSPEYLPCNLADVVISAEHHLQAQRRGLLLVALADGVRPVGFAHTVLHGDCLHLLEIDVDPVCHKQGIGTALLNGVVDMALRRACAAVTLTTYRDVPWNAPWYEKMGFREIAEAEMPAFLRVILENEVMMGLDRKKRVAMRRLLNRNGAGSDKNAAGEMGHPCRSLRAMEMEEMR